MKGGAVLVVGVEGTRLTAGERRLLARVAPFAVILLPRNLDDAATLRVLVAEIRSASPASLLALDAEGGRVDRLRRIAAPAPSASTLAACPPETVDTVILWPTPESVALYRRAGFETPADILERSQR